MRVMRIAQRIAIGAFVLALLSGMLIPVYTDEIGWRYLERAAIDGVDKPLNDLCGPTTFLTPPFFMWPVRYFSAITNSLFADPVYVRLSGVAYALIFAALLFALIRRIANSDRERVLVTALVFGLLALGMTPWLLVWSRPEQPLLIALLSAVLIAATDWRTRHARSAPQVWRRTAAIVALCIVALSYHLKGVLLVPAFAMCLLYCDRGRASIAPRVVMGALLLVVTALATQYWVARGKCPGDAILAAEYAGSNLAALVAAGEGWRGILTQAMHNANPIAYVWLVAPVINPMSSWLQPNQIDAAEATQWKSVITLFWKPVLYLAWLCIAVVAVRQLRAWRIGLQLLLPLAIFAAVLVWAASQMFANVYESSFVLPLIALFIAMAIPAAAIRESWLKWGTLLAIPLAIAAVASPVRMAMVYGPSLLYAAKQRAYIPEQPFSQPVFGYGSAKPQIAASARQCGIGMDRRARSVLIDDATYFTLIDSYRPQYWLGVLKTRNGSITDPIAYLKAKRSDGVVIGCHLLTPEMRKRAKQNGQFCCIGASSL